MTAEKFRNLTDGLEQVKKDIIGTTAILKEKDANLAQDLTARLE